MRKIYRIGILFFNILLPIIFGWWLFLPLILISIYLIKLPYEIILAAAILDSLYYFGDSFWSNYKLTLVAFFAILVALFLSDRLNWQRRI
jgi:membrane protein YdbS with pleckstrin-like domain